jgi:hypothetical protein
MNERKPYLIMWNGECGNCPFIARCGFFEIRHPDTGHICPLEIHAKQLTKINAPNDCHDFNGRFYVEEKI